MGFDLYGQNPKLKGEEPNINWDKKPSEEEKKEYFKAREKFEDEIQDIILGIMFGGGDH